MILLALLASCSRGPVEDTGEPCTPEEAVFVDRMAPGPHAAGRVLHSGRLVVDDLELTPGLGCAW